MPKTIMVTRGGGPGLPDLTQLQTTTGQALDSSAYNTLGVGSMTSGDSYEDPTTSVTIYKITDSNTPTASNTSVIPDYFESGPRISHPWGTGWQYTIGVMVLNTSVLHLVDFDLQSGTFSNWRATTDGGDPETSWGFSLDSTEPQMLYKIDGGDLRKWNTSSGGFTEVSNSEFPKDLSANLNGASKFTWLGQGISGDGGWFVMMSYNNTRLVAYRPSDNTVRVKTSTDFTGLDEPKFERNGRYVWVRHNTGNTWWDLDNNTVGSFSSDGSTDYKGHAGTPRGYATGVCLNSTTHQWNFSATGSWTEVGSGTNVIDGELNCGGQWVTQSPADDTQYVVISSNTTAYPSPLIKRGIAFCRMDGSDRRLLCHSYAAGEDHSDAYYKGYAWGQPSPDGRLVMFKSSMNSTTGRADTFLAVVPRA